MSDEPTVFVVDDDHTAAASMAALMTSVGLPVESFHSAEAFLAAHDGSRKGCLVLDMRLTGMSGLELLESLAARNIKLPTICISGHMDQASMEKARNNGVMACFEKPFNSDAICDAVRSALTQN
jgi:FixJ family two-component response regulator